MEGGEGYSVTPDLCTLNVDIRTTPTYDDDAAKTAGVEVEATIAGPANIGNYLAGLGIPATTGFGVGYVGLHGTDERARLDTIPTCASRLPQGGATPDVVGDQAAHAKQITQTCR
jgi:succinyl-diaminopimelate desuccinylase